MKNLSYALKSVTFRITNGTRKGSVLSPALFAIYLDGLLQQLRQLGVGCHLGGWWYGAACFADDLFLLAPSRTAPVMMLNTCEQYALGHNLQFSTDANPSKSKSKCIFVVGKSRGLTKPNISHCVNTTFPVLSNLTMAPVWQHGI